MAQIRLTCFWIYLVLHLFFGTFDAYQHRSLRRTALYQDQANQAVESTSSQESDTKQQKINNLLAELDAKLTLRSSAIHLLNQEGLLKEKRGGRHHHHGNHNGDDDGNGSNNSTLEELQQRLDDLNQIIRSLYDLLSSSFPAQSRTTTLFATTTSTSTQYYTNSARPSSPTTAYSTEASSNAIASTIPSFNDTISSGSSASVPAASTAARYSFEPMSSSNVAVYYGQTVETSNVPLSTVCNDADVDIIILAFVNKLSTGPAGYPTLNMGPNCWAATSAQVNAGATGLIDCVSDGFADEVKSCQETGKKILLSIGGAVGYSETAIASEPDAVRIADNIWNLFGEGGLNDNNILPIRPFGDFVFDGFDIGKHPTLSTPQVPQPPSC